MIIRVAERKRYTVIDNTAIEDARLSWRALGVLVFLLSRPDNWEANYRHLASLRGEGQYAVRGLLKELEDAGYIERRKERGAGGKFEWVQVIYENPQVTPCGGSPRTDNQRAVDRPLVDHALDLAPITSTDEVPMEQLVPDDLKPNVDDIDPSKDPLLGFPEFWEQYPKRNGKREGRGKAEQVWRRLSYEERKAAWRGARHYGSACDSGLTIAADAFRWLRDRRWEDWQDPAQPSTVGPRRGMTSALTEAGADELLRQYGAPNGGPPPVAGRALPSAT